MEAVRYQEAMPLLLNELQPQPQQLAVLEAQNAARVPRLAQMEVAIDRAASLAGW